MIKLEVMTPSPSMDFDFNGGRSSSCVPTTPKAFGNYFCSAPTSPMHRSGFYRDSRNEMNEHEEEDDFAFDICQQLEIITLSADELFDDGKIRPMETPPRSPISPRITFQNENCSRKKDSTESLIGNPERKREQERGRGRNSALLSSENSRRTVRSVSPDRVSSSPWEEDQPLQNNTRQQTSNTKVSAFNKGSKRWRLKDLFRSASEGRGTEKDPLRKYSIQYKKQEEVKNRSFKSTNHGNGSPVSKHEKLYTLNRAASEEMKKKTSLPYKKGILGGLLFNPTVHTVHTQTNVKSSRSWS